MQGWAVKLVVKGGKFYCPTLYKHEILNIVILNKTVNCGTPGRNGTDQIRKLKVLKISAVILKI